MMVRALILCLFLAVFAVPTPADEPKDPPLDTQAIKKQVGEWKEKKSAETQVRSSRLEALGARIDSASAQLSTVQTELARWDAEVQPLLVGEAGKPLAADRPGVEQVRALIKLWETARDLSIVDSRTRLKAMKQSIQEVLDQGPQGVVRSATFEREFSAVLETDLSQIESVQKDLSGARTGVKLLVAQAQRSGATGDITLQEAIDLLVLEETLARAQVVMDSERKERDAVAEAQAAAAGQKERALQNALLQKAEDEAQITRQQARKDELNRRVGSPAVQARLAPFITKSRIEPYTTYGRTPEERIRWQRSEKTVPISLTFLRKAGALENEEVGWRTFAAVAVGTGNDRPPWDFNYTLDDLSQVAETQKLLMELAPILIEKGLLLR